MREYRLEIRETRWEIVTAASLDALTFNGTVPGPELRATEGDLLRITIANRSSEPTSVHWHGLHVPNEVDGVAPLTGPAIAPGETATYEFLASHAGTFMYHAHRLGNALTSIRRGPISEAVRMPWATAASSLTSAATKRIPAPSSAARACPPAGGHIGHHHLRAQTVQPPDHGLPQPRGAARHPRDGSRHLHGRHPRGGAPPCPAPQGEAPSLVRYRPMRGGAPRASHAGR